MFYYIYIYPRSIYIMYMHHSIGTKFSTLARSRAPRLHISFKYDMVTPPEGCTVPGTAPTTYSYSPRTVAQQYDSSSTAAAQEYISTTVVQQQYSNKAVPVLQQYYSSATTRS
jgi:hypothetical protein